MGERLVEDAYTGVNIVWLWWDCVVIPTMGNDWWPGRVYVEHRCDFVREEEIARCIVEIRAGKSDQSEGHAKSENVHDSLAVLVDMF